MTVSFIATVYNEESTVKPLLKSLFSQSEFPDEIIIVDGGSSDRTVAKIKNQKSKIKNYKGKFLFLSKKGNRSVGRNEAIKRANSEIIVCSDAGCVLDKDWVKNIIEPFNDPQTDVVAGYCRGDVKNVFQKCLIPYVLVMPDKANINNFLPASRSMAFRKSIWKRAGRFPQEFSNNEDYVFAKRLKKIDANIVFEKRAIAYWMPRSNIKDAFVMFYRFAKGDAESHMFRPKVLFIFLRYIVGLLLVVVYAISKSYLILNTLYLILFFYILWSIVKNYRYVKDIRAFLFLPLLQIISDTAIILGTICGLLTRKLKILLEGTIYIVSVYLIILLNFRKLRSFSVPPRITEDGIVGYVHYFGYPLYFETIIFFIFVFTPIIVFFILSKIEKYRA